MDKIFKTQFNRLIRERASMSQGLVRTLMGKLRVPSDWGKTDFLEKGTYLRVGGISEPFFSRLNNSNVVLIDRVNFDKKVVLGDGSLKMSKSGEVYTVRVSVPEGSAAFYSDINIHLPRFVYDGDKKEKTKVTDGFGYIDFDDDVGKYIYYVPDKFLKEIKLRALTISPNRLRKFVQGYEVVSQVGLKFYLYVVDWRGGIRFDGSVLLVDSVENWEKHLEVLYLYWESKGDLVFNRGLCTVTDEYGNPDCLCVREIFSDNGVYEGVENGGIQE